MYHSFDLHIDQCNGCPVRRCATIRQLLAKESVLRALNGSSDHYIWHLERTSNYFCFALFSAFVVRRESDSIRTPDIKQIMRSMPTLVSIGVHDSDTAKAVEPTAQWPECVPNTAQYGHSGAVRPTFARLRVNAWFTYLFKTPQNCRFVPKVHSIWTEFEPKSKKAIMSSFGNTNRSLIDFKWIIDSNGKWSSELASLETSLDSGLSHSYRHSVNTANNFSLLSEQSLRVWKTVLTQLTQ